VKKLVIFTSGLLLLLIGLYIFPPISIGHLKHILKIIRRASITNTRIYWDNHGKRVEFMSDGLKLVGTLYPANSDRGKKTRRSAIVLLHGSNPYGRRLPLYRILGYKLSQKGYLVLTFDLRGFGESDAPPIIDQIESWNGINDVIHAIDYIKFIDRINPTDIYLVGHSMGANHAIAAGIRIPEVEKIVAIGPSRRVKELFFQKDSYQNIRSHLIRFSRDRRLDQLIPEKVLLEYLNQTMIDNYVEYFSLPQHKSLMLIDGELEREEDKVFLRELYQKMTPPVIYITIKNTDHYCNTTSFRNLMIYDKKVVEEMVDLIDAFLKTKEDKERLR
jgi:pimeloyl-ACP methyl ester carboxylesterase